MAVLLVVAGWALYPAFRLQYEQERQRQTLEAELAGLQERNETLLAQVERLKTPEGVEEAARENLGLVRAGEQVYVVTEGEATRSADPDVTEQTKTVTAPEASYLTKVLDFVFGVR